MRTLDFGFATALPGFRLHTLEIYNWGTFHGPVWQLSPGGSTTLLTGPNGAGKTTVVDALVTLLTPPQHRHFNQSSGTEAKRDRSIKSYMEGAYGTGQDAETGDVTAQVLRAGTGYYSWLSATFHHADLGQTLTLVQYRRFRQGELVTHYLVLPRAVSLKADEVLQARLAGEPAGWRTHLLAGGVFKETPSFEQYAAEWQRTVDVRSDKALTLFSKTVGMKMLGSLDEFVRREMLGDAGGEAAFRELYDAYRHLLEVYHLLQKAEHQVRLLQPVVDTGREYQAAETSRAALDAAMAAVPEIFGQRKITVLRQVLAQSKQEAAAATAQQQALHEALQVLKPRISQLEFEVRNSDVGRKLELVREQLRSATQRLSQKREFHEQYAQLAQQVGLNMPTTAPEFETARQQAEQQVAASKATEEELETDLAGQLGRQQTAQQQREQGEKDLEALREQRTLIPREMTALRQRLCQTLDISPAQIPFIGELLQVKAEAAEWRPAIEKLLHGVGLQLLVPTALAARINRYVHETDLGGRLVYHRVEPGQGLVSGELGADSLLHKLDIAERRPFDVWLRTHLYQHYNYCCTDDLARFEDGAEPLVLTSAGLTRTRHRHEKDDRPGKTGPRHYVLGWDNQAKITALDNELRELRQRENAAAQAIGRIREARGQLRKKQEQLGLLLRVKSFEELDWATEKTHHQQLTQQQEQLQHQRDNDEALRRTQAQLVAARAEEAQVLADKTQVDKLLGGLENDVQRLTGQLQSETDAWPNTPSPVPAGLWLAAPLPDPATVEEADHQRATTESQLRTRHAGHAGQVQKLLPRLVNQMNQFRKPNQLPEAYAAQWHAECANLLANPDSLGDYELLYQRLSVENLPQYQQQFQKHLTTDVLQFVFKFRKTLAEQLRDVRGSIGELNEALVSIDFSQQPRAYIRLTATDVRDGAAQGIAAFRARLHQAVPNQELLASRDPQQALIAFENLRTLLDELHRDDTMRRKVLDVRNWLQFGAEEVARETGQVINVYSNSGGRSGGEKAKLAYTVLAAAIAYQYNALKPGRHQPSFRFVVIDETFSKSDAANSTYALKLFAQLGLQLMIVTPLDNIPLAAPFIEHLHLVRRRPTFESEVWDLTLEQYQQRHAAPAAVATGEVPANA
ncbi:ATP-binding protein [Hymenobacter segetis]|uniref:SbcC/MukB-like Walker B domain-containing protein n=1 Tax=Hymenobacter segetis TaxID=2025509 RepID=A0ABU9M0Z1_9BACT